MLRGTGHTKRWISSLMRWVALSAALALAPIGSAYAKVVARAKADIEAGDRMAAPTMEDNASYFSERRRGVSKQDLQKADELRLKTISSIQGLLEQKKDKNVRRFELILRLGEIYVERCDYLRDLELESFGNAWDAWSKEKKGKEPAVDYKRSEAELAKAANSFRQLVTEFPKHPRTDAALYSLARVLARMNKDTAVNYYKQMIANYPKSPLIPDAYLSLGEWYFDKHRVPEAIENYKKVMDYKEHRAYPYAVYKLGWAYYNATPKSEADQKENMTKAVTAFKLVVKLSDRDRQTKPQGNFDLREEAIKDLIMVWADAEDVASAWNYFKTIGEQDSFYTMLERLGNIYTDQGKNGQAIAVFQRLLKDSPNRYHNPVVHAKLLELYDLNNEIPQVVAEMKNMQKLYLGKSEWAQANKAHEDGKTVAEAEGIVERNMHRYGAMFHQRGQKAKSDGYFKHAAAIYTMYLESFPKNSNAYDIRYYLAEIQFDFKQFESASDHYLIVAKQDTKGKYMKPAALNAVAAMNQLVQQTKWPTLPPPGQVPSPLEIPRVKQKLVRTIDTYVSLLPGEKEGEPMRFSAAQTFFDYGHYPEAIKRFAQIAKDIPESKQAKASVKIVLGYYGDKADWNKLISWSQTFAKNEKLMDAELKKYTYDLWRGAMFKRALAYEKDQKFERAAKSFLEFQKEFPNDANADRAVYNAMLNYYKVQKIELALATGALLIEKYPQSKMMTDVITNQATTYEALAKFDEAAALYRKLALEYPTDSRAPASLYNAAVLYKGMKKIDTAIDMLAEFTKRYPDGQIAADATFELATLLERTGKSDEAIKVYTRFAKKFASDKERALTASAKAAVLKTFGSDQASGKRELAALAEQLTAKDSPAAFEARVAVAGAMFKLQEPMFADFMATKITDGTKIEQQVTEKQGKLVKLAAGYEKVIAIGSSEHSVASLYRLGEAHENFSQALFKAPAPKGVSAAEVDKLKTELEKVAFPLKEEAYKFFDTAYKRSREVQTFTQWTRRTYQKMVELAPEKHAAVDELSADATYLSHDLKMSKPVAELVGD